MLYYASQTMKRRGDKFEARLRNNVRQKLNVGALSCRDIVAERSKNVLLSFLQNCRRNQVLKAYTYEFLNGIYKVHDQMLSRIES